MRGYVEWNRAYDDPNPGLSWRLRTVQQAIEHALDERPGRLRALSACSGNGRDLLGVLADPTQIGSLQPSSNCTLQLPNAHESDWPAPDRVGQSGLNGPRRCHQLRFQTSEMEQPVILKVLGPRWDPARWNHHVLAEPASDVGPCEWS